MDVAGGFPLADLVGTLGVNGHLITVGLPDDPLPPFKASGFTKNGASIGGSHMYVLLDFFDNEEGTHVHEVEARKRLCSC